MQDNKKWSVLDRAKTGSLKAAWFQKVLGADKEEQIVQFNVPGTDAVVLTKLDPYDGLSERAKRILMTDEELEAERQAIREEAVLEYKARQEMMALPEGIND